MSGVKPPALTWVADELLTAVRLLPARSLTEPLGRDMKLELALVASAVFNFTLSASPERREISTDLPSLLSTGEPPDKVTL